MAMNIDPATLSYDEARAMLEGEASALGLAERALVIAPALQKPRIRGYIAMHKRNCAALHDRLYGVPDAPITDDELLAALMA